MELTTGAILRRITETPLSAAAHKLATIILDGIAWKDGYNGLERGTAAFTLGSLADKMGVSRQHLNLLLAELASSALGLFRSKPHGKFAPWLFRFGAVDNLEPEPNHVSATDDTSLSRESKNKMMFVGKIEIRAVSNVHRTPWGDLIKAAKTALPCWNVDTQEIWDAFRSFNQAKGNAEVPAGYLLGFMRKWRATKPNQATAGKLRGAAGHNPTPQETVILDIIKAAPITNRHFHASDLRRAIGSAAYAARVLAISTQHGCSRFTATLVVHGQAVLEGEITR